MLNTKNEILNTKYEILNTNWEPKIIAFCCLYCAFAAADLAGAMRLQYPHNIRIIKLPCTGKLDLLHILESFHQGIDGVFIAGCLEGNCHFLEGNLRAKKRVEYAKKLLAEIGIEKERLEMYNLSSAMGGKFAEISKEMVERIKKLGPNPIKMSRYKTTEHTEGIE
ncbi:MAG: hydrogenase iron-sulfur subunit [Armatimonadetes bacterium]|nr:hydrogenase iron-sulfur subunit [Armatimonadota bacterium]